jgi:hypothetical protein
MGKIIFWIVVFFVVLLVVRLVNVAATKARRNASRGDGGAKDRSKALAAEPTVRCVDCGTYLPKSEAKPGPDGYRCGDPACTRRR